MDQLGDRWAFLRPWCAPVHGKLSVQFEVVSRMLLKQSSVICVALPSRSDGATPSHLRAIRHALLLLSMLARVDCCACKHVLIEHCGLEEDRENRIFEPTIFRDLCFSLVLADDWESIDGEWFCTTLTWLLTDELIGDAPADTHELVAAARQILAQDTVNPDRRLSGQSVDIPIALGVHQDLPAHLEQIWAELKALHAKHSSWRFPVHLPGVPLDCKFALGPVTMYSEFLDGNDMLVLEDMATNGDGLKMDSVGIPSFLEGDAEHAGQFYQLLERLVCSSGSPATPPNVIGSVTCAASDGDIARVCSAIAEARIPTHFTLQSHQIPEALATWVWQWVAYAFFSWHARERSSITSVFMSYAIVTVADAEAIAQVLAAADPLRVLFPQLNGQWCTRVPGMLKAGTTITLVPMHESEVLAPTAASWKLKTDVSGVALADVPGKPDHVRMLLPGYGLCEVRRADVVPVVEEIRPASAVTSLNLEMGMYEDNPFGFERFMELIGPSLTCVEIQTSSSVVRMAMPGIVRCCPNLKTLVMGYGTMDASEFVRAYNEAELDIEELCCNVTDLADLAVELKDTSSRLAKSLKHLECDMPPQRLQGWPNREVGAAVADMLQLNKTLEYMRIEVPGVIYNSDEMRDVLKFHNQLLPVTQQQFPLACRLAFLSVFVSSVRGSSGVRGAKIQARASPESSQVALSSVLAEFPMLPHISRASSSLQRSGSLGACMFSRRFWATRTSQMQAEKRAIATEGEVGALC